MTKKKKSHLKLSKRGTGHVKNFQSLRLRHLSRLLPRSKKSVAKVTILLVVIIAVGGSVPFPYTFAKTATVPFTTDNQQSAELELTDSKVIQEGADGTRVVQVSSFQSMWGRIFGLQPIQQKEVASTVSKPPISKVVAKGTKKYQYMLCSDGNYRYYTDKQFSDPQTGFTSKSEDDCKKNGQGEMILLSDTASGSGSATSTSGRSPTVTVRNGCTYTSIPYKTVYRDVSWLNKGETRVYKGSDGTKSSCGWSTNPTNEEILRGTSEPSSGFNPSPNASNQNAAAYQQCLNSYNSAMSQIQASISQGMSGQDALKQQVESEFARCKRAAGY